MNTRQSLNGLRPRAVRDMERDAFDWCDQRIVSHILGSGGAMRKLTERDVDKQIASNRERYEAFFESAPAAVVAPCKPSRLADFIATYRQYRKAHGVFYSARIAYGCAFRGLPF